MNLILPRRKFLIGEAVSLLAAPAIVCASSLMRVKPIPAVDLTNIIDFTNIHGREFAITTRIPFLDWVRLYWVEPAVITSLVSATPPPPMGPCIEPPLLVST